MKKIILWLARIFKVDITKSDLVIDGDLIVKGDIICKGSITATGDVISYKKTN